MENVRTIDGDVEPRIPEKVTGNWKVLSNRKMGRVELVPEVWDEIITSPGSQVPLDWNTAIFDWLLRNQGAIPRRVRGKYLIFNGTVFVNNDGNEMVRALYYNRTYGQWMASVAWSQRTRKEFERKRARDKLRRLAESVSSTATGGGRGSLILN